MIAYTKQGHQPKSLVKQGTQKPNRRQSNQAWRRYLDVLYKLAKLCSSASNASSHDHEACNKCRNHHSQSHHTRPVRCSDECDGPTTITPVRRYTGKNYAITQAESGDRVVGEIASWERHLHLIGKSCERGPSSGRRRAGGSGRRCWVW